jgi:hypothetical protein
MVDGYRHIVRYFANYSVSFRTLTDGNEQCIGGHPLRQLYIDAAPTPNNSIEPSTSLGHAKAAGWYLLAMISCSPGKWAGSVQ